MHKHNNSNIEKNMITKYHTYNLTSNQCTSTLVHKIKAPIPLVWSIIRRFDHPQAYKSFIRSCTMLAGTGGTGSVREVEVVSGLPAQVSRERLDRLEDDTHVMTFTIIGGDHRLSNYKSTTTVHEKEGEDGTVVIESYVVDVPKGNTEEETRVFVDTILGCNLKSLAFVSEKLASK